MAFSQRGSAQFLSACRRPGRASHPRYPFSKHALNRYRGQSALFRALLGSLVILNAGILAETDTQKSEHLVATTNAGKTVGVGAGPSETNVRSIGFEHGATLARAVCQSCHLFPEPALLDKATWEKEALPFMGKWLGMSKMRLDLRPGGKYVEAAGLFPAFPILPAEDWEAICKYYVEAAPAKPAPQPPHPGIHTGLKGFETISPDFRFQVPLTTLVKIDAEKRRFYLGDAGTKTLSILDPQGNMMFSSPLDSPPVSLVFKGNHFYATLIGSVTPSDEPQGKIVEFERTGAGFQRASEPINGLPRPTDAAFADLNNDGKEDVVICGFGNYLGRFSWFENLGDGKYREHVLLDRPGAIKAYVHDFNKDGRPDIIVMMAQAREGIFLFTNKGGGEFSMSPLVEFQPAFGSSYFELVDFNHDGFIDILATNGDNGDLYMAPLKNYHGIRLYLNDGRNNFRESWFFPLNGAYRAMARDFDHDGNLDIAAISFYPDYDHAPEESFVFLKNRGGLEFDAFTFPDCKAGRWITMDVGDLDGDGAPDIVLGSFIRGPNKVPPAYSTDWEQQGPSFLILKNVYTRIRPAGP